MLIGLYGESRSGKDTIARIIEDKYGYEWRAFANPLRRILLDINPFLPEMDQYLVAAVAEWGWDIVKARSVSSVDMMINLGQSARDNIYKDIWVDATLNDNPKHNVVISDVRQMNEFDRIKKLGGEVWKIVKPGTTKRGMDGLLDHIIFSVVIHNDGTAIDLETTVKKELYDLPNRRD